MPEEQAATYLRLHGLGPSKAATLARVQQKSRPQTYRLLDAMAQHGYVLVSATRPHLFTAAPIQVVLDILNVRIREAALRMKEAEVEIVGPLREAHGRPQADGHPAHFTMLRGDDAIVTHAKAMVRKAATSIDLVFTHQGSRNEFGRLVETMDLERRAREIPVRLLICRRTPEAEFETKVGPVAGETRILDTDTISTYLLADNHECLVVVTGSHPGAPELDGALAFLTTVPEYVAKEKLLFDRLWTSAAPWVPGIARESTPPGRMRSAKRT